MQRTMCEGLPIEVSQMVIMLQQLRQQIYEDNFTKLTNNIKIS